MKKLITSLLSAMMIMSTTVMPAMANDEISVTLNGSQVQFDVPPQMVNERTMVPVRAIFEALGATVDWNQSTQTVTSQKGDVSISLTINDPKMMVNNKEVILDQPACIIDERTLVPVRAISEAYNLNVDWNNDTRTVVITTESVPQTLQTPSYDNVESQVNQIKSYISQGMYLEAMDLCNSTTANYNLSTADKVIISDLYDTAENGYNEYLESTKKPASSNSAFDVLKNDIINRGEYDDGEYEIKLYLDKSLTTMSYEATEDKISLSMLDAKDSSNAFISLTIKRNENARGGFIMTNNGRNYSLLYEYRNGQRSIVYNEFPSHLNSKLNSLLDAGMRYFDTFMQEYSSVKIADFGIYY